MKRTRLLFLAVLIGFLLPMMASGQQGMGSNVVGYTSTRINRGEFGLLSYDFLPLSGSAVPSNVLASTLPSGAQLYVWDLSGQRYVFESLVQQKGGVIQWAPGTNRLTRGAGFWVKIPDAAPSNQYSVFMIGEVPSSQTAPQTLVSVIEGFNLIGYPYPVTVIWTNTSLAQSAAVGDQLYTYTGGSYLFNTYTAQKGGDPYWTITTQTLDVGSGYWFRRSDGSGGIQWVETKPYTWP